MLYYPELNNLILSEPHFLIGGTTGSGKSVLINTICRSLAAEPVNLFLLDPKRVEFSDLAKLPNCKRHETETDDINAALMDISALIDSRYTEMQKQGLKKTSRDHVLVVVDEIADLMLNTPKTTTPELQHIAQIGRAAGVHLLLATQVLRADILPLKITSNISGRIALRCRNSLESRLILGEPGAEFLPRYGQALVYTCDGLQKINVPMYESR